MSAKAAGSKAGRRERHLARQAALKERKAIRKARAAPFAHLPGQQPRRRPSVVVTIKADAGPALAALCEAEAATLGLLTVDKLRAVATDRGVAFKSKDRKADLIAKIVAAPVQDKYEAQS